MEKRTTTRYLEFKFAQGADAQTGSLTGYGAVFGNTDDHGDIIAPGAFTATLAAHKSAGTTPLMLLGHDLRGCPIGVWDDIVEDGTGLLCRGRFLPSGVGQDARVAAQAGQLTGLSIGFIVKDSRMEGRTRVITEAEVLEISLVTIPANSLAQVTSIKSQENHVEDKNISMTVDVKLALESIEELNAALEQLQVKLGHLKLSIKSSDDEDDDDDEDEPEDASDDGSEDREDDAEDLEDKYDSTVIAAVKTSTQFWESYGRH